MNLELSLGLTGGGQRGEQPPAGLGWPAKYQFTATKGASGWTANINARGLVPGPFSASATVYWVRTTGSDANSGLTEALAKRSINAAITAGNATGGPYKINVEAGEYNRANGPGGGGGTVKPTQDCAIVGYGATRPVTGLWDDLAFADDGSGTNTYQATLANVARVLDRLNTNMAGSLNDLTRVADVATVRTTLGAYVLSGGVLYVRRADLAAVTATNTRVLRVTNLIDLDSTSQSLYLENLELIGGITGCVASTSAAVSRNVVAVDVVMGYAGAPTALVDCWAMDRFTGLALAVRCTARAAAKDGFNIHQASGSDLYSLTINCTGIDNGRFTSQSNNGLTLHETVVGIDVGGIYSKNYGVNVHHISSAKMWCLGTAASDSQGDASLGGSIPSTDFRTDNTARMWLQDCTSTGSTYSIVAASGTTILKRRFTGAGAETGSGTIGSF